MESSTFFSPSAPYDVSTAFEFLDGLDAGGNAASNGWSGGPDVEFDDYEGDWSLFNGLEERKRPAATATGAANGQNQPGRGQPGATGATAATGQGGNRDALAGDFGYRMSETSPVSSTPGSSNSSYNSDRDFFSSHRRTSSNYGGSLFPLTPPYLAAAPQIPGMKPDNGGLTIDTGSLTTINPIDATASTENSPPISSIKTELSSTDFSSLSTTPMNTVPERKSSRTHGTTPAGSAVGVGAGAGAGINAAGSRRQSTVRASASKVVKPKKEKTSHNMIEKRYRTNINEKILALRNCVPSLRCVVAGGAESEVDLEGLTPASKLNKATVLTKATEYIMHLQSRNESLQKELEDLKRSVGMYAGNGTFGQAPPQGPNGGSPTFSTTPPDFGMDVAGAAPAYPNSGTSGRLPDRLGQKVLMGAMVGFMGAGMMAGDENRALSAVPGMSMLVGRTGADIGVISMLLKMSLVVGAVVYLVLPMILPLGQPGKKAVAAAVAGASGTAALPSASSSSRTAETGDRRRKRSFPALQLRMEVWEISSRSLGLPLQPLSLLSAAVWAKAAATALLQATMAVVLKLYVIPGPLQVTWSRAIESQLCGGDSESSSARVLLTLVKSYAIRPSAVRFARQAAHIRILTYGTVVDYAGLKVAQWHWATAKRLAAKEKQKNGECAMFATNLREILDYPAMLEDREIVCKMQALVLDKQLPTGNCQCENEELCSILEDVGIRSVIDTMATCHSWKLVQRALLNSLGAEDVSGCESPLTAAGSIISQNSILGRRVAVAKAVLCPQDSKYLENAVNLIRSDLSNGLSNFAVSLPEELRLAMHASFFVHYIACGKVELATAVARKLAVREPDLGLLGFVAIWRMINAVRSTAVGAMGALSRQNLEKATLVARVWVGGTCSQLQGLSTDTRRELVGECLKLSHQFGDLDMDEGYFSP